MTRLDKVNIGPRAPIYLNRLENSCLARALVSMPKRSASDLINNKLIEIFRTFLDRRRKLASATFGATSADKFLSVSKLKNSIFECLNSCRAGGIAQRLRYNLAAMDPGFESRLFT